jgi:hypothetical protein
LLCSRVGSRAHTCDEMMVEGLYAGVDASSSTYGARYGL